MRRKQLQHSYLKPNREIMLKRERGLTLTYRIKKLRKEFNGKTQTVRSHLLTELEELAEIAAEKAKSTPGKGKAKTKQNWMRIAAYIAQTITYVAREYDTSKIDAQLDELERLFRELKQAKESQ